MQPARLALAALLLAEAAAAAEYTITRRTSIDQGTPADQTEYWSHKRLVVDDPAQTSIVDFGAGRFTAIDKDARTYVVVPLDDLRRQLLAVGALVDALPPALRDLLGLGRAISLSPNGNSTRIADHDAREYGIGGEQVTGWLWLAEDLDPGRILGDDAAQWWRSGGPLRAVGPLADVAQAISEGKLKGMPMWVTIEAGSANGTVHVTSQVTAVREEPPPPDVGKIPDGYRRAASPLAR